MGQYNKAIITNAGESLIARAIVGEIQLEITKAKTSDYKYPGGTDFKALTDMQGVKQVMTFPETKVLSGDMIQTRTLFSNEEISTTYYIQNIGLYAMDGTQEVLFCIVTSVTPDEMPQYNGVASTAYIYNIQSVVQDAETIHITVNPSGTATVQDVLERVDATGGDISETVIETLETIDTKYPIPKVGEKVKTFFGKIITFMKNIKPLEADMTVHVSTTGSDITGTGMSTKPFRTIGYALSMIPKDLGGFGATINIADGGYEEDVVIKGYRNGTLQLSSSKTGRINVDCIVKSLVIRDCTASVKIESINMYESTDQNAIAVSASTDVELRYIKSAMTNPGSTSIIANKASNVRVYNSELSNHGWAIYGFDGSKISSIDNTGTNNKNVVFSTKDGAIITTAGTAPSGTKSAAIYDGGIITYPSGAIIGSLQDDITLYVCTSGDDITGDGTEDNPYETIQHAIDSIPRDLGGHQAKVLIEDGTYDGTTDIIGYHSGTIIIECMNYLSSNVSFNCVVSSFRVLDTDATVYIQGFQIVDGRDLTGGWVEPVCVNKSSSVRLYDIKIVENTKSFLTAIYANNNSTMDIVRVEISNHMIGCHVDNSFVYIAGGTGTNNGLALKATNDARISLSYNKMSGDRFSEVLNCSAIINDNGTQISDIISSGLSCTWGTIQGGYIRNGNPNGTAMITIQLCAITTVALSVGENNYSIKGFPKPVSTGSGYDFSVATNRPTMLEHVWFSTNAGDVRIVPARAIPVGTVLLFNATYLTNS